MSKKTKYYSLDKILQHNAEYNIIYGERSNGKTTAVQLYGLKKYIESGYIEQMAIIRRWETDFKGKNGAQMFEAINKLGYVKEWTKGEYNTIYYYSQRWYLVYYNEDGKRERQCEFPFAMGFSIGSEEHYKSTSYPNITTVLFDEFITRSIYLTDEFVKFQNLLSTIIRDRDNIKIFMCGNTINMYCPYFAEMGITGIKKQKQGTIDVYKYGDNELSVAVEYSDFNGTKKKSNKYFAFNNPKLKMITSGSWEIDIYPHLPFKYLPKDVKYTYIIIFDDEILQCEIIQSTELKSLITYIHRKTTPIKEDFKGLIFSQETKPYNNYRKDITKPMCEVSRKIYNLFLLNKVFYQNNEIGEIVRNYINECKGLSI